MQKLAQIIDSIDGKPLTKYTSLYGYYSRDGIGYNITNIYGGQTKYCSVELVIPAVRLFGDYKVGRQDYIAASAHILREFAVCTHLANDAMAQSEAKVEKGMFLVYRYGQRVLENSVVRLDEENVTISLNVRLPLNKPTYMGPKDPATQFKTSASAGLFSMKPEEPNSPKSKNIISARAVRLLLVKNLPTLAETFIGQFDMDAFLTAVLLYRDQNAIRAYLAKNGYVSFIGNGSILPRRGKTDFKEAKNAVPFASPPSMEIGIDLPSGDTVYGMGIPRGITIVTGDAYHGKSTLLDAIQNGIYNHIPGDGREYVITDDTAMSVHAEDGRSVKSTDISFFLTKLPVSIDPKAFTTDNASGSTSQAAAVAEAVEAGCRLMLFDEDRSANNFMYKDEKMRTVIPNATTRPYVDNARMLYRTFGISSVIVVGASGDAFRIADRVVLVDQFMASEYTDFVRADADDGFVYRPKVRRYYADRLRDVCMARNLSVQDNSTVKVGTEVLNVPEIIPHVTRGQLDFIVSFLYYFTVLEQSGTHVLRDAVAGLYRKIARDGMNVIRQNGLRGGTELEFVRMQDMSALLYRMRSVSFK